MRQSWNDVLVANEGVLQELKFWLAHVDAFNGYPINRPLSSSAALTCDASETGYGAHVVFYNERKFCSGMWNELQRCTSSSYREFVAVLLALKRFQSFIAEKKVAIFVVPEKKIVKLKSILTELINDFPNFKVRRVASVSGFVISLSVALGPVARLFTRQMYFFINLRQSWNDVLVANEGVLQELKFSVSSC